MPTVIVSTARRVFQTLPLIVLVTAVSFVATAQPTLTIGQNYTSSTFNDAQAIPPDANGAIGPHQFIEFINGTIAVYNRTNGVRMQRKTNIKFWGDAGVLISSDSTTTDPRVIYDPSSHRWFATQVDVSTAVDDPATQANDFLLAVSTTDNPAGTWHGFSFQADPDTGAFADFPTLGFDADAVYISGDFFTNSDSAIGSGLVSIPKADLLSSTPTIDNRTWFGIADYTVRGQVLQPAMCFDGSSRGNILSVSDIGMTSDPHSNVVAFAVQNATNVNATLSPISFLNVLPFYVPDNAELGAPCLFPTQSDNTSRLQANDARFAACVRAINGIIYAAHSTEFNGKIAIRWYRLDAATRSLLEMGTISDTNLDLFFPSIAANSNGVVVICCNGCSINTYVSSFAYVGQTVNGTTTFAGPNLLYAGAVDYHDDYEQFALEDPTDAADFGILPFSRWGDYSATTLDPNDPNRFWTIQIYPQDTDVWATQITELIVTPTLPRLSIALANNNAVVSWPSSASAFHLETAADVTSTSWTTVNLNLSTNNNQISFTTPVGATPAFFRLKQ